MKYKSISVGALSCNRLLSKCSTLSALALVSLILGYPKLQAQTETVNPVEYPYGLRNPLMGLREPAGDPGNAANLAKVPFATVVRKYIHFNELDNNVSHGLAEIKKFTNDNFEDFEKYNIKVVPRVILQYTGSEYYWPSDLASSERNYTSAVLRERVLKMVANMGKAWDGDPRIAWVEVGLIGQWGEQESPQDISTKNVKPDNKSWAQILAPAFQAAFKNKKIQVRGPSKWTETPGFEPGVYWDTWASESSMLNQSYDFNAECVKYTRPPFERYKTVPQGGEIAYSVKVNQDQAGTDPLDTYTTPAHRTYIANIARKIFTTNLGMEFSSAVGNNPVGSPVWNKVYAGAQELQKAMGYRFLIDSFACNTQLGPDRQLAITAKIRNDGTAPLYANWPLKLVLIDPSTKAIVWTSGALNADVSTWYPGSDYDWTPNTAAGTGTLKYLKPAAVNTVQDAVTIPTNIANGTYYVGLAITDPTTDKPGVFFAVKNFFKASNTHPLCEIGIGVTPTNPKLNNVAFDNYDWLNDTRSYSLIASPPATTYTLSETSLNGSVTFSPSGPTYAAGTTVTVTSVPDSGYYFSNWGGDLSGTTNPTTIVMNSNKSIVANVANTAPVNYTLIETSPNGSVTFSPVGPSYPAGTTVTVTSVPAAGYYFSSWGGDLSGTTNPTTIVMNSNKSIVANVANTAPVNYTLIESSPNGSVTFSPAGPTYPAGTTVTVTSVPAAGYYFSNWGGDLSGTTNPTTIVMNSNKSIAANVASTAPVNYTLIESSPNGSVTFSPAGPTYPAGTTVTVTSVPAAGYVFTGWSGDLSGTTNSTTIVINSNKSIVANTTVSGALPSPWSTADIGLVGATGSATYSSGTWTILGSGADIWDKADAFRYLHQNASGDCSIEARVTSLQNTHDWAKAGVMIRENTDANARFVMLCVTPSNGVSLQYRPTTGGFVVLNFTISSLTVPKWLKLTRTGNSFMAYYSNDGKAPWTQVGTTQTVTMGNETKMGLALTSHNGGVLCTSVIDGVLATP